MIPACELDPWRDHADWFNALDPGRRAFWQRTLDNIRQGGRAGEVSPIPPPPLAMSDRDTRWGALRRWGRLG